MKPRGIRIGITRQAGPSPGGEHPERAHTAETLAAVIHKQPDWEKAPAQVRNLLRRCLEKDPKNWLRDISVAKELQPP